MNIFWILLLGVSQLSASDALPDLIVDADRIRDSAYITQELFEQGSCSEGEGCLTGTGLRRLLRFDTLIRNKGPVDLYVGPPEAHSAAHNDACHGHFHLGDVTSYELLRPGGEQVLVVSRKQGFCMRDDVPPSVTQAGTDGLTKYDCDYQGIQTGWADLYASDLDCQWLDITGLSPGAYILRITVNPTRIFVESNYQNNVAETLVTINEP